MALFIHLLILAALLLLFAAGLRLPKGTGRGRWGARILAAVLVLLTTVMANLASYRNDHHFDATQEEAFTPRPETLKVLRELTQDVELTYFYQGQNPASRAARQMVEVMGKVSPHLKVRTVDPDLQPALASQMGVRMYNAAVWTSQGRRIEVVTTEDAEMTLGLLRLLRNDKRPVCFLAGHGEYDIDNFEFHTHFEGRGGGHSHDSAGQQVVQMEQHGIGRLRRALDKLGYAVRRLQLATGSGANDDVPEDCATLVEANPRTAFTPMEVAKLERYLSGGGALLLLAEPDYELGPELAALLARAGVGVLRGSVADPISHYFTDEQMVAVDRYASHPALRGLALSFFPGIRPLRAVPATGVRTEVLFSSSAQSLVQPRPGDDPLPADEVAPAARPLALASTGQLAGGAKPFRLAVIGDADFASNSFYPYMANADLTLGLVAWLRGESSGVAMKPAVEVLPTVVMTNGQMRTVFIVCVLLVPGGCALMGVGVWWQRRR